VLSGIWGSSYLFIKLALDELEPAAMMSLRLLLACSILGVVLVVQVGWRRAVADVRATGRHAFVLGLLNGALPFWLIAWGEKHVASGIASIANATVPIFVALLAIRLRPSERSTGVKLVGVLLGFAGVAVLVGLEPRGGWWAVGGTLAVVFSSLSYARGNLYAQQHFASTAPLVISAATALGGAVVLVPFGLAQLPGDVPSWRALGSVAALGIGATAIGSLLLYRLIKTYGAARTALVTYLLPVFALFYGAVFLDESVPASAVGGLVLILAGVALGSGVVRVGRSRDPVPAAPQP
jgi:drug/metabolite transporter (DMT)-like permease